MIGQGNMEEDPEYQYRFAATGDGPCPEPALRRAMTETLKRCGVRCADVSVVLVGDDDIARLNERYLGHAGPTDVLAFDHREDPKAEDAVEGELFVSTETADRQARDRNHPVDAEIALYVVHGLLHLAGHRDDGADQAQAMHRLEDDILESVGLGRVFAAKKT